MSSFFSTLPRHLIRIFTGRNLAWHIAAIVITVLAVTSGLDYFIYASTRNPLFWTLSFPAIALGGLLPMLVPLSIILTGGALKKARLNLLGWALGQAAFLGWLVSSAYKSLSGRVAPPLNGISTIDLSHQFLFGFWRGGIFWGWPSSHTTVAFALSVTLVMIFPKKKVLAAVALLYALYVGLAVSITIHWFSDFLAGAIIGTIIGIVVGTGWKKKISAP